MASPYKSEMRNSIFYLPRQEENFYENQLLDNSHSFKVKELVEKEKNNQLPFHRSAGSHSTIQPQIISGAIMNQIEAM